MFFVSRVWLVILLPILISLTAWPNDPESRNYRELIRDGCSALAEHRADQALDFHLEALKKAESKDDYLAVAALHNLIGELHEGAKRYQMALSHYESALRVLGTKSSAGETDQVSQALERLRAQGKEYNPGTGPPVTTDLYRGNPGDLSVLLGHSQALEKLQAASMLNAANMYLQQNLQWTMRHIRVTYPQPRDWAAFTLVGLFE